MNAKWIAVGAATAALATAAYFALGSERGGGRKATAEHLAPAEVDARVEGAAEIGHDGAPEKAPNVTSPRAKALLSPNDAAEPSEGDLVLDPEQELKKLRAASVTELRLPVIHAIRANYATDTERKEAMLAALRASGSTDEPWAKEGADVFEEWAQAIPGEVRSTSLKKTVACYRAGCEIAVRFGSQEDAAKAAEAFRQILEPEAWHGGRIQTPAVDVGGGAYEATWIMLRPS